MATEKEKNDKENSFHDVSPVYGDVLEMLFLERTVKEKGKTDKFVVNTVSFAEWVTVIRPWLVQLVLFVQPLRGLRRVGPP